MARKSQYANEQLPLATGFSPFRVPCILTVGTLSKRSPFSPLCTSWTGCYILWRLYIQLPRSRWAVLQRTCARFFCGRKFLKLLTRLTVCQAVPETPISVGSKLELLLRAFVFAKCPYTSLYTHAFARVCIPALPCIIRVYLIHDRGAEGFAPSLEERVWGRD